MITATPSPQDESYLQLQLDRQTRAALPLKSAQKVLVIAKTQVTPIPNTPKCFLGVFSQRSRVYWAVDLSQILGRQPAETAPRHYSVVIVNEGEMTLGFVVREVRGVTRLAHSSLQPPTGLFDSSLPYLRGCLQQQGELLLVLNVPAIARSPALHSMSTPRTL